MSSSDSEVGRKAKKAKLCAELKRGSLVRLKPGTPLHPLCMHESWFYDHRPVAMVDSFSAGCSSEHAFVTVVVDVKEEKHLSRITHGSQHMPADKASFRVSTAHLEEVDDEEDTGVYTDAYPRPARRSKVLLALPPLDRSKRRVVVLCKVMRYLSAPGASSVALMQVSVGGSSMYLRRDSIDIIARRRTCIKSIIESQKVCQEHLYVPTLHELCFHPAAWRSQTEARAAPVPRLYHRDPCQAPLSNCRRGPREAPHPSLRHVRIYSALNGATLVDMLAVHQSDSVSGVIFQLCQRLKKWPPLVLLYAASPGAPLGSPLDAQQLVLKQLGDPSPTGDRVHSLVAVFASPECQIVHGLSCMAHRSMTRIPNGYLNEYVNSLLFLGDGDDPFQASMSLHTIMYAIFPYGCPKELNTYFTLAERSTPVMFRLAVLYHTDRSDVLKKGCLSWQFYALSQENDAEGVEDNTWSPFPRRYVTLRRDRLPAYERVTTVSYWDLKADFAAAIRLASDTLPGDWLAAWPQQPGHNDARLAFMHQTPDDKDDSSFQP